MDSKHGETESERQSAGHRDPNRNGILYFLFQGNSLFQEALGAGLSKVYGPDAGSQSMILQKALVTVNQCKHIRKTD
jgi:hypothetical protein